MSLKTIEDLPPAELRFLDFGYDERMLSQKWYVKLRKRKWKTRERGGKMVRFGSEMKAALFAISMIEADQEIMNEIKNTPLMNPLEWLYIRGCAGSDMRRSAFRMKPILKGGEA